MSIRIVGQDGTYSFKRIFPNIIHNYENSSQSIDNFYCHPAGVAVCGTDGYKHYVQPSLGVSGICAYEDYAMSSTRTQYATITATGTKFNISIGSNTWLAANNAVTQWGIELPNQYAYIMGSRSVDTNKVIDSQYNAISSRISRVRAHPYISVPGRIAPISIYNGYSGDAWKLGGVAFSSGTLSLKAILANSVIIVALRNCALLGIVSQYAFISNPSYNDGMLFPYNWVDNSKIRVDNNWFTTLPLGNFTFADGNYSIYVLTPNILKSGVTADKAMCFLSDMFCFQPTFPVTSTGTSASVRILYNALEFRFA